MGILFYIGIVALPYIICAIMVLIMSTKLIKSNFVKILLIIIILILGFVILINVKEERPDDLCRKMAEISDNQTLIGLSKEEAQEKLGKPMEEFNDAVGNIYSYYAGNMDKGVFLGKTTILYDYKYMCELRICFDENDIVKSTSIKLIP